MPPAKIETGPETAERTARSQTTGLAVLGRLNRTSLLLWATALSLIFFFLPLQVLATTAHRDVSGLETNLTSAQASLNRVPTPLPEIQRWLTPLAEVQGQLKQVQAAYPALASHRADWPAAAGAIANYDPNQIVLTSVTASQGHAVLEGRATGDGPVLAYAAALEQSNLFSSVIIQSLQITNTVYTTFTVAAPTLTATATYTPTSTPTATPDLRDSFEPDATQPQPLALGTLQQHNFYPNGDVDNVTFLAKALQVYRVYTSGLAPGVDTLLTVRVGGMSWTNDDVKPGDLSSQVIFQNPGSDAMALVTVTNRGQYGPSMIYQLGVEELAATPTSVAPAATVAAAQPSPTLPPPTPWVITATPQPTALPTSTPVPTSTNTPELTPTNTPRPSSITTSAPTSTPTQTAPSPFGMTSLQDAQLTCSVGLGAGAGLFAWMRSSYDTIRSVRVNHAAAETTLDAMPAKFVIVLELGTVTP
jgi:Tfp pilus assembly protein PilN